MFNSILATFDSRNSLCIRALALIFHDEVAHLSNIVKHPSGA